MTSNMFSNALKSFTSNISSNYTIAPQPSSTSGPWNIFDAKRKATGKQASVFVFEKKSLQSPGGGLGGGGGAASLKRAQDEVLERLKKEASSLARLRHPSVLELAEPIEDTRSGGLMFATEAVTASLASLLRDQDDQERSGGRSSRYVVEETDGTRQARELEIDELEIQKGLLQLGKGLEFLHESAGLLHANLTPEAIVINAKGDWKLSGLGFAGPHQSSTTATSLAPISLHEVLNHDPRLPRVVQLNFDYTSPDFVLDRQLTASADMFSLGLLIVCLYNTPHSSPINASGSLSSYQRIFASPANIPKQSNNFLVPSSHPLPPKLASELLPKLITRRASQRLSAKEFQDASYFDNILVSTIRFLDALPAKSANEKAQFMRGLMRIMSQFPKSVLEKKLLPALLDETKDRELLAPIMSNLFGMVKMMPSGKSAFTGQIAPKLTEVFVMNRSAERDTSKEAGLMIFLENMQTAAENCSGKEFREHILPILAIALESPTHGIVDAALSSLPFVLAVLDFSTIKNELFPVTASVFAKTSSLAIKIRALEAFYTLCGGSASADTNDDLNGIGVVERKKSASSAILDRFTVQEKVVPLLRGIKTKEPGVMMAALKVLTQVGEIADSEFLAMEVLPILWSMSLGPLLNLQQFQAFMTVIKRISSGVEREHTKKLRDLGSQTVAAGGVSGMGVRSAGRNATNGLSALSNGDEEVDFESLVTGRKAGNARENDLMNDWGPAAAARPSNPDTLQPLATQPAISWQSLPMTNSGNTSSSMARAITPDQTLSSMPSLTPTSQFAQPLQPSRPSLSRLQSASATASAPPLRNGSSSTVPVQAGTQSMRIDWSSTAATANPAWSTQRSAMASSNSFTAPDGRHQGNTPSPFGVIPPPPSSGASASQKPPHLGMGPATAQRRAQTQQQKSGLDKYESLL